MKKYFRIIFTIFVFALVGIIAAYGEEDCRKMIRSVMVSLNDGQISFFHPRKYFAFPTAEFILSSAFYFAILFYLLYPYIYHQQLWYFTTTSTATILSITIMSFIVSKTKLATCTACDDGTMVLNYNDISYNTIFGISYIVGILFVIIPFSRKQKSTN